LKRDIPIASESTVEQVLENSEETNYKSVKLSAEYGISSEPVNAEQEPSDLETTPQAKGSMVAFMQKKLAEGKATTKITRHMQSNTDDDFDI